MVALLVLFTIVACLVVDGILMSVRERHAVVSGKAVPVPMENMVFAQDGGEPRGPGDRERPEHLLGGSGIRR